MSQIYRKVGTGVSFAKGKPVLDIFCRDENNNRIVAKVFDLPIYFYLKEDETIDEADRKGSVIGEYSGYYGLFGEHLKKIKIKRIAEMKRLGRVYKGYESDVKWDKKSLLDLKITDMFVYENNKAYTLDPRFNATIHKSDEILTEDGLSVSTTITNDVDEQIVKQALEEQEGLLMNKPRIGNTPFQVRHGIFDIEVIVEKSEDLSSHIGKVVCVVIWDSYTDKYHKLKLETTERDLIERVLSKFKELDFDIISGWNVEFDMGWIFSKADDFNLDLSVYFGGKTFITKYTDFEGKFRQKFYIAGRTMVDGMELYKKKTMTTEKLASYNLKSVAAVEGFPEWEDLGAKVKELWDVDSDKVTEYCRIDVERTMQILEKKDLLGGILTIAKFYGCGFDDVTTNSKVIESMAFLLKRNRILPNIVRGREKAHITGAKVFKTTAGMHTNVGIYDAKSLYPSIIKGLNISPECLMAGKDLFEDRTADCVAVDIDGIKHFLIKREKKMGLMTEVIEEMQKMREDIRSRRRKAVAEGNTELVSLLNNEEKVSKGVLASVYGVMGFNGFRLFNEDCANIITAVARGTILGILDKIESPEYHVIYGDTDSVFIKSKDVEAGLKVLDKVNEITFDYIKTFGISENVITIAFEKFFKWVMFTSVITKKSKRKLYKKEAEGAKKKYIGFISHIEVGDGEMKEVNDLYYKGFELRRSDSSKVLKIVMKKFFNLMEDGNWEKAVAYLKTIKAEFHTYDKDFVSMPRSVNNEDAKGPWPDGLRYSKTNLGFDFTDDTMPRLLYVRNQFKYPKTKVICYQDGHVIPAEFQIDYDVMYDKIVKAKFEPIIEALGLYWDTCINNQGTLDLFCQ